MLQNVSNQNPSFMKILLTLTVACCSYVFSFGQRAENIIKSYFSGWENKNWDQVLNQLAKDFTFTSPNNDDHISIEKFKEKCWVQANYIKGFEFITIIEHGNSAFAILQVNTKENKVIRNAEFFTFKDGKIQSIEVFFGGTGAGYPSNAK